MSILSRNDWTKLMIASLLMCLVFSFGALAQSKNDPLLDEKAVSAFVEKLKEELPKSVKNKDQVTEITNKWDARKDLVGNTEDRILRLLFIDLRAVVKERGEQLRIWGELSKLVSKPITTPIKCSDGLVKGSDGSCVLPVYAFRRNNINLEEIGDLEKQHNWSIASREQVTAAWEKGVLDEFAFLMIDTGDFCVPIQKDVNSFKRGTNCGDNRGNQGFLYVHNYTSMEEAAFFKIEDEGYSGIKLVIEGFHIRENVQYGGGGIINSYLRHVPYIGEKWNPDLMFKFYIWRFEPAGDGYYYIKCWIDQRQLSASKISERFKVSKELGEFIKEFMIDKFDDAIVAGDVADNNLYLQAPNGRDNAKWKLVPLGNNKFHIIDKKHGLALVGGDKADGKIYHQAPNGRANAIWNITLVSGNKDIPKEIKVP